MLKKPMLASEAKNLDKINFPVLATPKLDGVRATVQNGIVYSRSLKPIPNLHVQDLFGSHLFEGLDGELIVGDITHPNVYNHTVSGVMSKDGQPDVKFVIFDKIGEEPYVQRLKYINKGFQNALVLLPVQVDSKEELLGLEASYLEQGYEGVMIRQPDGKYKHGRSTEKEGYLLKIKQFSDMEATIVGYEPWWHNGNEAHINELGRTERSSHKENKVAMEMLGAYICKAEGYADTFKVGTGFNHKQREQLWLTRDNDLGKMIKIKYQPAGELKAPRFPVWLGFREEIDL